MTTKTIAAMFLVAVSSQAMFADITMVTNIYDRVNEVYAFTNVWERPVDEGARAEWDKDRLRWDPYDHFLTVRGGGFLNDGMTDKFVSFCGFVSNRCNEIVADWPAYETNDVARFTLSSAIGFTSFSNMTNLAERVLSMYEKDNGSVSTDTLFRIRIPAGTPPDSEHYLALNIDVPGVSNIVQRLRNIAVANSNTNGILYCDACLSGELKAEYLAMKEAGMFE